MIIECLDIVQVADLVLVILKKSYKPKYITL